MYVLLPTTLTLLIPLFNIQLVYLTYSTYMFLWAKCFMWYPDHWPWPSSCDLRRLWLWQLVFHKHILFILENRQIIVWHRLKTVIKLISENLTRKNIKWNIYENGLKKKITGKINIEQTMLKIMVAARSTYLESSDTSRYFLGPNSFNC